MTTTTILSGCPGVLAVGFGVWEMVAGVGERGVAEVAVDVELQAAARSSSRSARAGVRRVIG
jgi:hypothetical protein